MRLEDSVLLYHVYIKNNWKEVTKRLLNDVPHSTIYVNVNVDWFYAWKIPFVVKWFKKNKKVKKVFFTLNKRTQAEVLGFEKLRSAIAGESFSLATYIHGKGVTKPDNKNIQDWVELMRYFIIDRMDLCLDSFNKGYKLYGVNLGIYNPNDEPYGPYKFSRFHFSGNFVSINLETLRNEFLNTPIDKDYFGVEGFWGKLCNEDAVFCPHSSKITNHYKERYPASLYKQKTSVKNERNENTSRINH